MKSEVFLKLHRLRQVYHEQEIVDEAIETFTKLVNQIGKRSHLSPEQQVSSAVFRMSKSDYEIKRVEILEEIASLDAYFKISIGEEIAKIKSLLPLDIKSWPEFENDYKIGSSPKSKVVQAELDASRAGLSLAKSESWPTITLGPSVQIQNQGDQTSQMYGFNLSLPIPLFNSNNGERALANGGVVVSEVRKSSVVFEEKTRRAELLKVFNESKRALMSILSHKEMENQHAEMDALFAKGIVSSALIIEAHRTFIELEKTRHQREMKAIEAMVSLYVIDGKDWESLL